MPYSVIPPGEGTHYEWGNDTPFVKVSGAETGGAYCLIEDNLKPSFSLGLHRHDTHAETFYILEGALDFYLEDRWVRAKAGTTLHVPPGVEHACKVADGAPAKMLMVMQPSGFDEFLAVMAGMAPEDFEDSERMAALNKRFDIIELGPVPDGVGG